MRLLHTVDAPASMRENLDIQAFEEVLACNIKDVIADFCLTDADIIRSYADNQQHGNMDEMMAASAELYFKGETLSYGYVAHVRSGRGEISCVVLEMEFAHEAVTVFFQIIFGDRYIGVKISEVLLDATLHKADFNLSSFAQIISSARLQPLPSRYMSSYCLAGMSKH